MTDSRHPAAAVTPFVAGGAVLIPFLAGMGLALGSLWGKIALAV